MNEILQKNYDCSLLIFVFSPSLQSVLSIFFILDIFTFYTLAYSSLYVRVKHSIIFKCFILLNFMALSFFSLSLSPSSNKFLAQTQAAIAKSTTRECSCLHRPAVKPECVSVREAWKYWEVDQYRMTTVQSFCVYLWQ